MEGEIDSVALLDNDDRPKDGGAQRWNQSAGYST